MKRTLKSMITCSQWIRKEKVCVLKHRTSPPTAPGNAFSAVNKTAAKNFPTAPSETFPFPSMLGKPALAPARPRRAARPCWIPPLSFNSLLFCILPFRRSPAGPITHLLVPPLAVTTFHSTTPLHGQINAAIKSTHRLAVSRIWWSQTFGGPINRLWRLFAR